MFAQVFAIGNSLPADRFLVGGKAAGLGELCRAGAPVPPGVVVVMAPLSTTPTPTVLDLVFKLLRSEPGDISLFAVRSSAIKEDGRSTSFAGMFETLLNIGRSDIAGAMARCIESGRSSRLLAYAAARSVQDGGSNAVPVIIQRMVAATAAGVAFTADPISGDRNLYTIEAAPGLGEAVVSGLVTPDKYTVDIRSRELVDIEYGDWPGAETERALDESQLDHLVTLLSQLRSRVTYEIDVEFAFHGAELYALQMRPITVLPPFDR